MFVPLSADPCDLNVLTLLVNNSFAFNKSASNILTSLVKSSRYLLPASCPKSFTC